MEVEIDPDALDQVEETQRNFIVFNTIAVVVKPSKRISVKVQQPQTFFELIESKQNTKILSRPKLRGFLNYYGTYPEKHRTMIWRFLLRLPENRESYESMLQMGLHPQIREFRRKFPLKSDSLSRSMEKYFIYSNS